MTRSNWIVVEAESTCPVEQQAPEDICLIAKGDPAYTTEEIEQIATDAAENAFTFSDLTNTEIDQIIGAI